MSYVSERACVCSTQFSWSLFRPHQKRHFYWTKKLFAMRRRVPLRFFEWNRNQVKLHNSNMLMSALFWFVSQAESEPFASLMAHTARASIYIFFTNQCVIFSFSFECVLRDFANWCSLETNIGKIFADKWSNGFACATDLSSAQTLNIRIPKPISKDEWSTCPPQHSWLRLHSILIIIPDWWNERLFNPNLKLFHLGKTKIYNTSWCKSCSLIWCVTGSILHTPKIIIDQLIKRLNYLLTRF